MGEMHGAGITRSLKRQDRFFRDHPWDDVAGPDHSDLYGDDPTHVCDEDDPLCLRHLEAQDG